MNEFKLRGYVTPEDFEGSDAERIQKALDTASKEDICRVILKGNYKADTPITVPSHMHLVFDGGILYADLQNEVINNFSFESDRIYIEGKNGCLFGNISFCHTRHTIIENLKITGSVTLNVSRDLRIEHVEITDTLALGRGCQNAIVQYIKCGKVILSGKDEGYDIMGRERIIKSIAVRASEIKNGATLIAAEDCKLLNVQIDGIRSENTCITLGDKGESLPKEQYCNLTFTELDAPKKIIFNNEYLHAHIN